MNFLSNERLCTQNSYRNKDFDNGMLTIGKIQLFTFKSFPVASRHLEKFCIADYVVEGFPHLIRNLNARKNFAAHRTTTFNMVFRYKI